MLRGSAVWGSPAPAANDVPLFCIAYRDHWELKTKSYSFAGILRSDALTLENLRELTACRAQAYESSTVTAEERLRWQVALWSTTGYV